MDDKDARGVAPEYAEAFLEPAVRDLLPHPTVLADVERAVERLAADLDAGGYSPLLQEDMAADDARYAGDTAAACDQAWASFGPGSPVSGLLQKR